MEWHIIIKIAAINWMVRHGLLRFPNSFYNLDSFKCECNVRISFFVSLEWQKLMNQNRYSNSSSNEKLSALSSGSNKILQKFV